jgi:hypothetical protein
MTEPLTHARIGYDSITDRATISASAELTGFPASAAANQLTYSFWSAGLPATWEALLAQAETCNYFGIAAHTLWTNNAMAVLQAWIDGAWATLPVLTTTGDLWRFDDDLFGLRGAAPSATVGSFRVGVAADGRPVHPFFNDAPDFLGSKDSKFGRASLTVEAAATNLFPQNVRTGGDTSSDLTGFDVASEAVYRAGEQMVSGVGSVFVKSTGGGPDAALQTDPVAISVLTDYAVSCKLTTYAQITAVTIELFGDVTGSLGSVQFDNVPAGVWNFLQHTETTGAADTTLYAVITIDAGNAYVDELQLEAGTIATTWFDGARGAGDLAYQPEIIQQIANDITVNVWAKLPVTGGSKVVLSARNAGDDNSLQITKLANDDLVVTTKDASGGDDFTDSSITWDDEWRMITVVVRPGVSSEIYIDGRLSSSGTDTKNPDWANVTIFQVGHKAGTGRVGVDGESGIDDLTILNRAATATEIRAWYDSGERMDAATAGIPSHEDDRPIMVLTEAATSFRFRIRVVGQTTPLIGVIKIGQAFEMMRPLYGGHAPINLSRATTIRPTTSERGQFLGRSIIREGARGSWSWNNLTAAWVRKYLDPFVESARLLPFFVLWRPSSFPGESSYVWTMTDQSPVNSGSKDRMAFSLEADGLANE